jgi:hypothetical protein|nr:MAG TPA: hypothetical protein [Caudoviricetes sp.]
MQLKELMLYIENHGISIVFMCLTIIILYRSVVPFMKEALETQKEMKKFMQSMNMNTMRGKGLEMVLNFTSQGLRWSLQKRIIQYIIDNNISLNWIIILREIDLKIEEKKHEIYTDLRDIIDKVVLKVFMTILDEELTETKNLIISLLEDLKEHGKHDKSLYVTAERSVETHFEHFENRMYNKIKDLLN